MGYLGKKKKKSESSLSHEMKEQLTCWEKVQDAVGGTSISD